MASNEGTTERGRPVRSKSGIFFRQIEQKILIWRDALSIWREFIFDLSGFFSRSYVIFFINVYWST